MGFSQSEIDLNCPACGSELIRKKISSFASLGGGSMQSVAASSGAAGRPAAPEGSTKAGRAPETKPTRMTLKAPARSGALVLRHPPDPQTDVAVLWNGLSRLRTPRSGKMRPDLPADSPFHQWLQPFCCARGAFSFVTSSSDFLPRFIRVSSEDPLNTKPVIKLSIGPERHIMQLLESFFFRSVLESVKNRF